MRRSRRGGGRRAGRCDAHLPAGAPGRVELRVSGGHLHRTGYSGGGELQAVFRNGPWTYVVYERAIRTSFSGRSEPRFEAGVDVLRSDRTVSRRRCLDPGSQFEGGLPDVLPQDDFVEH